MHLLDALNALADVDNGDWVSEANLVVHYDAIPDGEAFDHRQGAAMWQLKLVPASVLGRWKRDMEFMPELDIFVVDGLKMMHESVKIGPDTFFTITMKRDDI